MENLAFYHALSRFRFMNYRAKIMVVAFVGTHVPLIALIADVARRSSSDWSTFLGILSTALVATLTGTGVTLYVLNQLLKPVLMTSRTLRGYRETRALGALPTDYSDEVGTLMADADVTLRHLEDARVRLEHFDGSTGLANRDRLALGIEKRIAAGEAFAVCVVALNCHARLAASVDEVRAEAAVRLMARRLEDYLGADAVLARIGSERFGFVIAGDEGEAAAGWPAARETLSDAVMVCGGQMKLGEMAVQPHLTGGIATSPQDGRGAEELLDRAGAAASLVDMKVPISFFSPKVREEAFQRFRIEEDLRTAIRQRQFALHYQPVVDVALGRAVGAEALIRWNHPERGQVPPGLFIPVAESAGLIGEIGLWVMDTACAQVAAWDAAGLGGLSMAINLSARQFRDPALIDHVRIALERNAIGAGRIEFELTESAAMDDFAHSRAIFGKLRDLGIGVAIDDFGTGFASLSYLRRLPFDKLKLDREFVTDVHRTPQSQAICGALIELAGGLGLRVLAEGTETEDEVRYLHGRGCRLFQGYYLSRPVPAPDFAAAINAPRIAGVSERMLLETGETARDVA